MIRAWPPKKNGYSLVEVLVVVGLSAVVLAGLLAFLSYNFNLLKSNSGLLSVASLQSRLTQVISDDCAWSNTFSDSANTSLACLVNGSCPTMTGGFVKIRNKANEVVVDTSSPNMGLDANGKICSSFDAVHGNDACPYQVSLAWQANCGGVSPCLMPSLRISAVLSYQPAQLNSAMNTSRKSVSMNRNIAVIARSCKDLYADGVHQSGFYLVDPDGAGGGCPFKVYCDMQNDGGGWSLVVNAPRAQYSTLPVVETPLDIANFGRLPDWQIQAILAASGASTTNNIKTNITGTSGPLVVSMSSGGGSAKNLYSFSDTSCSSYDAGPDASAVSTDTDWGFIAGTTSGYVGIDLGSSTFKGFSCQACGVTLSACTLPADSCCGDFLPGSVWVR